MSSRSLALVVLAFSLAALLVVACSPSATPTPAAATKSPAAAATPAPTGGSASASVERGQAVFQANCNGCHPGGASGVGPDIRGKSQEVVKEKVRKGGGSMPPFSSSQISDEQLNDLAAYVNSLKR